MIPFDCDSKGFNPGLFLENYFKLLNNKSEFCFQKPKKKSNFKIHNPSILCYFEGEKLGKNSINSKIPLLLHNLNRYFNLHLCLSMCTYLFPCVYTSHFNMGLFYAPYTLTTMISNVNQSQNHTLLNVPKQLCVLLQLEGKPTAGTFYLLLKFYSFLSDF